jgi:hypothetical protein
MFCDWGACIGEGTCFGQKDMKWDVEVTCVSHDF